MLAVINLNEKDEITEYCWELEHVVNGTLVPRGRREPPKEENLRHTIPAGAYAYHKNYANYLAEAYAKHRSIVLTPDIVWYTVLSEIARYVKDNVEECRNIFTVSEEKEAVVVITARPSEFDLP